MAGTIEITLDAPVEEVTLMEDRARVVRKGKQSLNPGMNRILIERVSPLISDKTLLGHVKGQADLVSSIVRRERREVKVLSDVDPAKLSDELRKLSRKESAINELVSQANSDIANLMNLEQRSLSEMGYDSSWAKADPQTWQADLDSVQASINERSKAIEGWREELRDIAEQSRELNRQLEASSSTTEEYCYSIEALVEVKEEGECELSFEYIVPSACWRPCHLAILKQEGEGEVLEMHAEGCVWQNTGEDWKDVQLHFSTQRPSLGLEPPALSEDLLTVQRKPEQLVVETRDQAVQDAGMGQGSAESDMPGIDDGGEVLNLCSASLADVPSDGRPYRVEIFTFKAPVESGLVCMPELVTAVIYKSTQTNTTKYPLLAGPVDLVRNSGKVGNTTLDFVAPGERFELGWGPDAELRVQRWAHEEEPESKMLSSWEETKKTAHIRFSNIGGEIKTLALKERIPVSEIEDVEIKFHQDETTDKPTLDSNGFIEWKVELKPFQQTPYKVAYTLRKKKSVVGV